MRRVIATIAAACGLVALSTCGGRTTTAEPAAVPATIIDLSRWKLTLPVDTPRPGVPDEVRQPELATFADPARFLVRNEGVVFRAHCGGTTTRGSSYPRCELREMKPGGRERAAWATDDGGVHRLTLTAAVTAVPPVKPHVVCAQIHDAEDDVIMVRLEGAKLFVERKPHDDVALDAAYALGTRFDLEILTGDARIRVRYDGAQVLDWEASRTRCYFKAGCYTQSNPRKGDQATSYGEVVVYRLDVEH